MCVLTLNVGKRLLRKAISIHTYESIQESGHLNARLINVVKVLRHLDTSRNTPESTWAKGIHKSYANNGGRPYKCEVCGATFFRSSTLKVHRKRRNHRLILESDNNVNKGAIRSELQVPK